jgi:hypothetical protein
MGGPARASGGHLERLPAAWKDGETAGMKKTSLSFSEDVAISIAGLSLMANIPAFIAYFASRDTVCMAGIYLLCSTAVTLPLGVVSLILSAVSFKTMRIGFRVLALLPLVCLAISGIFW